MIDGVLYLNDKPVPKVRVADYVETVDGDEHHVPQYRETLPGGKSYLMLDRDPDGPDRQYRRLSSCRPAIIS